MNRTQAFALHYIAQLSHIQTDILDVMLQPHNPISTLISSVANWTTSLARRVDYFNLEWCALTDGMEVTWPRLCHTLHDRLSADIYYMILLRYCNMCTVKLVHVNGNEFWLIHAGRQERSSTQRAPSCVLPELTPPSSSSCLSLVVYVSFQLILKCLHS